MQTSLDNTNESASQIWEQARTEVCGLSTEKLQEVEDTKWTKPQFGILGLNQAEPQLLGLLNLEFYWKDNFLSKNGTY